MSSESNPQISIPGGLTVKKGVGKEVVKELVAIVVEKGIECIVEELKGSHRKIDVINELDRDVLVRCKDKNINIGDRWVPPGKSYHFFFDRSFWGVTHFWGQVWLNGEDRSPTHFPVYNEGAPADNNIFAIREDGIYIKNGEDFTLFRERNDEE